MIGVDTPKQDERASEERVPLSDMFMIKADGLGVDEEDVAGDGELLAGQLAAAFVQLNQEQFGGRDVAIFIEGLAEDFDVGKTSCGAQALDHGIAMGKLMLEFLIESCEFLSGAAVLIGEQFPECKQHNSCEDERGDECAEEGGHGMDSLACCSVDTGMVRWCSI